MTRYGIRLEDGRVITDEDWTCPADVMRGAHGQGVRRMPGVLVQLDDEGHPLDLDTLETR